jgi:cell division transport system permease protein
MYKFFKLFTPKSYILPLHKRSGSVQLFILLALMTALVVIIASVHLSLFKTVDRWQSLIQYQASIEIPALDEQGNTRDAAQVQQNIRRIKDFLKNTQASHDIEVMDTTQVAALLNPWLGDDGKILDNIDLPTIINFKLKASSADDVKYISERITKIAPRARLQTHENWLDKFLAILHGVHILGVLIIIITMVSTIFVISSSVRARMNIYNEDLSLLHIMGARDRFILKQFITYLFSICVPACLLGYICASLILAAVSQLLLGAEIDFLPSFGLNAHQFITLMTVPFSIFALTMLIGSHTVLREMKKMP